LHKLRDLSAKSREKERERGAQSTEDEEVHDANRERSRHDPRTPAQSAGPARQFDEGCHQVGEEYRQDYEQDDTGEPVEHPQDQGTRKGDDNQPKHRAGLRP
jgi:hypothetical protein